MLKRSKKSYICFTNKMQRLHQGLHYLFFQQRASYAHLGTSIYPLHRSIKKDCQEEYV